jgi:hypothetical protein
MGIAFSVAELMVHAVDRHPLQRSSLVGERTHDGQEVFHETGRLKAPVSQKPVVTHGYAEARKKVEGQANHQPRPRESEWGKHNSHMDDAPPENGEPIKSFPDIRCHSWTPSPSVAHSIPTTAYPSQNDKTKGNKKPA